MGMYLNPGNAGFQSIRKTIYIDKSELIAKINQTIGTKDKLTCVSRPRRFGKSFATQMLCAYYDKTCNSLDLFSDLKIAKDSTFEQYRNRYHVIYLDITWFISTGGNIKNTVFYLQEQVLHELYMIYPFIHKETSFPVALAKIAEKTGDKFIIIIDEWDALFREAKEDIKLQKEYIQLLRGLFKSHQTDKMLEAAYMTGILPIKKYGTQSALTDFQEYTMLQPKILAEYTGFTEAEVSKLCRKYQLDFEQAKRWYDGYSFSKIKSVYNPNSIMQAVKSGEFANYWTETETYESLKVYIEINLDGIKEALMQMLGGNKCKIDTGTFQNDMTTIKSRDDVFTLLVHLGYLAYDGQEKAVYIPNMEIRQEFIRAIKAGRHTEIAKLIAASDVLLQDTLLMESQRVADKIAYIHQISVAPNFYNNEQALRSVIRFAYICCIDEFKEIQELPSGHGYADIVYFPKKNSSMPILVIELKWNQKASAAIQQIKEKNYPQIFEGYGSDILLVGISYDEKTKKHECVIEKMIL